MASTHPFDTKERSDPPPKPVIISNEEKRLFRKINRLALAHGNTFLGNFWVLRDGQHFYEIRVRVLERVPGKSRRRATIKTFTSLRPYPLVADHKGRQLFLRGEKSRFITSS